MGCAVDSDARKNEVTSDYLHFAKPTLSYLRAPRSNRQSLQPPDTLLAPALHFPDLEQQTRHRLSRQHHPLHRLDSASRALSPRSNHDRSPSSAGSRNGSHGGRRRALLIPVLLFGRRGARARVPLLLWRGLQSRRWRLPPPQTAVARA